MAAPVSPQIQCSWEKQPEAGPHPTDPHLHWCLFCAPCLGVSERPEYAPHEITVLIYYFTPAHLLHLFHATAREARSLPPWKETCTGLCQARELLGQATALLPCSPPSSWSLLGSLHH